MSADILIIDDDKELCSLLQEFLELDGFITNAIHNGSEAVEQLRQSQPDAIVLDIMLPGIPGLEVLREVRQFCETPILMLTARGEDTDRILGLELGADDYLPKPCNPRELAARLRAILRRARSTPASRGSDELTVGETHLSSASRTAQYRGKTLNLTSAEFNVLKVLLENAGEVVSKDMLSESALRRPLSAYDRSIDVHISKIRKKLAEAGAGQLILSVRGAGYQYALVQDLPAI